MPGRQFMDIGKDAFGIRHVLIGKVVFYGIHTQGAIDSRHFQQRLDLRSEREIIARCEVIQRLFTQPVSRQKK